jgi:hypothetical protein
MIIMNEQKRKNAKEKVSNAFAGTKRYFRKVGKKAGEHAESEEGINGALGALAGAAIGEAMLGLPSLGMITGLAAVYATAKAKS